MELSNLKTTRGQRKNCTRGKPISFDAYGNVVSYQYDLTWDFGSVEVKAPGKRAIVSFTKTRQSHLRGIQQTLYDLYFFYREKNCIAPTASQLSSWRLGLQHIGNIIGSTDWSLIDDDREYRRFKNSLKDAGISRCLLAYNITNVLNKLHDAGLLQRLVSGNELLGLAKTATVKQHIAIPIRIYAQLLSNAIKVVEIYHPYRYEIARVMAEAYDIERKIRDGGNLLSDQRAKGSRAHLSMKREAVENRITRGISKLVCHSIPDFKVDLEGKQLGQLQSACSLVTLAFSGVRIGESVSFSSSSYEVKKIDDQREISVLRGKTSKGSDGTPKTATWQTHHIVKDALELAQEMSEPLRQKYRDKIERLYKSGEYREDQYRKALNDVASAFIPLKPSVQKNTYVKSNDARQLTKLLQKYEIRATKEDVEEFDLLNPSRTGELKVGEYLPKLTPHDFRRSFAVFFKRYGFGSAAGIKFQYKHENINMSDYYANNAQLMHMNDVLMDIDLLKLMEEEGIKLGIDIYDDIYNKSAQLSGGGGERIASDKLEKIKAGLKIYMTRAEIEMLVRNGSLSAVQLPTGGYCVNPRCERLCGMGLFGGESKNCVHKVVTDKSAKKMASMRNRLIEQFREFNNGDSLRAAILVGIKQKIKEIEITLKAHGIEYVSFEDKIAGIIYG